MTKQNKKLLSLSLIVSLVAIGVHVYLAKHFYGLKFGALSDNSLCNISDVFNCDTASASSYASLFKIPIAIWGAVTNFALLVLVAVSRFNLSEDEARAQRYPLYLATFIALVSVIMGTISAGVLKAYCLFCMTNYALSFINLGLIWGGTRAKISGHFFEDVTALFKTNRGSLGILASVPVLAYITHGMALDSYGMGEIEKIAKEKVAYWAVAPEQKFDLSQGLVSFKGNGEAKMTIVEFADFKCPHCKHAAPSIHTFIKSHPDVKLIFKPFPLDGVCNSAITGGDGTRCRLAYATFCAEEQNQKGWDMHNHIFDNQESYMGMASPDEELFKFAQTIGLSVDNFKQCLNSPEMQKKISTMAQEGVAAQIQGTPTVFVNGRLLSGGQLIPILEATYQAINSK